MSDRPIKVCCEFCGSDNVSRDDTLAWSVPDQCWEVKGELDCTSCDDCGEENCLKNVPLDDVELEAFMKVTSS